MQHLHILRHKLARVLTFAVVTQLLAFVLNWYGRIPYHPVQFNWFLFGLLVGGVEQFFFSGAIGRLPVYLQLGLRMMLILFTGVGLLCLVVMLDWMPPAMEPLGIRTPRDLWGHSEVMHVLVNGIIMTFFVSVFMEMERLVGARMFRRFLTGRYARPRREDRVLMFIDLEGSTRLTEQLGDRRYFDLLNRSFELMTGPILESEAEVLKYVGDEVILTWTADIAVEHARCLHLYHNIREALEGEKDEFMRRFGVFPKFHAALHRGEVIVAQVGTIKRSIDLSGDAMNTCARLAGLAKTAGAPLASTELLDGMRDVERHFRLGPPLVTDLRGKELPVTIRTFERTDPTRGLPFSG